MFIMQNIINHTYVSKDNRRFATYKIKKKKKTNIKNQTYYFYSDIIDL